MLIIIILGMERKYTLRILVAVELLYLFLTNKSVKLKLNLKIIPLFCMQNSHENTNMHNNMCSRKFGSFHVAHNSKYFKP